MILLASSCLPAEPMIATRFIFFFFFIFLKILVAEPEHISLIQMISLDERRINTNDQPKDYLVQRSETAKTRQTCRDMLWSDEGSMDQFHNRPAQP